MDSSYNNDEQGVPGVKPGIISSGSGTTPPVMTPPITTPPVMNPMANDIVLNNGTGQHKSKKGLLVVSAVLIAISVVVAVVFGIIASNNNGEEPQIVQRDEPINLASFNRLANYTTYGTESDASVQDITIEKMGEYLLGLGEKPGRQVYTKIKGLVKDFTDEFVSNFGYMLNGGESGRYYKITRIANYLSEMIEFMEVMNPKEKISGFEITEIAEASGSEEARRQAMEYYNFASTPNNSYATSFMSAYNAWVDALLNEGDVEGTYLRLEPYYNMTDDFADDLSSINNLLMGFNVMGGGVNEQNS